jgi:hypothetical protein
MRIFELRKGKVGLDQVSQAAGIDDAVGMAKEAQSVRQRQGEDVGAPEAQPDVCQSRHAVNIRRTGKVRGIHGTHRRADDEIRPESSLQQSVQHTDLDSTEAAASSEDEGCPFISVWLCARSLQHG